MSWIENLLSFIYRIISKLRDREVSARNKLLIKEKVEEANEAIGDMSLSERNDILDSLHKRGRGSNTDSNNGG